MTSHFSTEYSASATVAPYVKVPAYDIEHAASVVYVQGFESASPGIDGWTGVSVTAVRSAIGGGAQSGSYGIYHNASATGTRSLERVVTGLTSDAPYTLSVWVKSSNSAATFQAGVTGLSASTATTFSTSAWTAITYSFTATATSHTLRLISTHATTTGTLGFWDSITLTRNAYTQHVPAVISTEIEFGILDGGVTLDDGWSPYVQASIDVPAVDPDLLDRLDPLEGVRITLTASRDDLNADTGASSAHSVRTFNLALRDRQIDIERGTMTLTLESDESLLEDYARNATASDTAALARQSSLRSIINTDVLGKIGATLEPGTVDAPFYILTESVNLLSNPTAQIDLTDATSQGLTSFVRQSAVAGAERGTAYRLNGSAGSSDSAMTVGGDSGAIRNGMQSGKTYTASGVFLSSGAMTGTASASARRIVAFTRVGSGSYVTTSSAQAANTAVSTRLSVTFTVPAGATEAFVRFFHGHASTSTCFWYDLRLSEGTETAYFDGDSTDTSDYGYNWTGTAGKSTSTRTPLIDRPPELLSWEPGESALDFVEPLLTNAGLRLWCDESRKWRLTDASWTVDGRVTVAEDFNAVSGSDTISLNESSDDRDIPAGVTGIVVKYNWTNPQGNPQSAVDVAGTAARVHLVEFKRPYPGPGAAAHILSRSSGRGRVQDVTVLSDFSVSPGQEISISLPDIEDQSGTLSAITWNFSEDTMQLKSRGLIDTDPDSWFFTPDSKTFANTADAVTWASYTNS